MSRVRGLVGGVWILVCCAFVPAGSCAKGCSACGRSADDVARASSRSAPAFRTTPRLTDDLARSRALAGGRALGETEVGLIARAPSPRGATLAVDDAGQTFARDYARSIPKANVTRGQHGDLLDAFDAVQIIVDLANPSDGDVDRAVVDLDGRLAKILDANQREKLHANLGTTRQMVERIARERPVQAQR